MKSQMKTFLERQDQLLQPFLVDNDNDGDIKENSISSLNDARNKLLLCVNILKGHQKRNPRLSPRAAFQIINWLAISTAATHLGYSITQYKAAFSQFAEKYFSIIAGPNITDTFGCDDYFELGKGLDEMMKQNGNYEWAESCDSVWGATDFAKNCLVDALREELTYLTGWDQQNHVNQPCIDGISDILEGQGMWDGYIPVIVIFGLTIPLILSNLDLCTNGVNRLLGRTTPAPAYLPDDKASTIKTYALKYGIAITEDFPNCDDYSDMLEQFEEKLAEVKENIVGFKAQDEEELAVPAVSMQHIV